MLDVGAAGGAGGDDTDLGVFVDRLAAGGSDRATALAHSHITATIAAGAAPPGLRRLAEALAASVTELPPPRRASDDPLPLVEAMRGTALAVLEAADPGVVATAVGDLVADGRRVIVTAADPAALSAVRDRLPEPTAGRSLDRIPALPPADLRELRRLLATSTPARRARGDQDLPADPALPPAAEVAELCERARRPAPALPDGTATVPDLLDGLDPARRAAVVEVAGAVTRALAAMPDRDTHPWAWRLLAELVHAMPRSTADDLLADACPAVDALARLRTAAPVAVAGPLPAGALDALRRYREFLDSGGRSRSYFRSPVQREVQPVLARTTVDGRHPETAADIGRLIEHLEIAARLTRVDARCGDLGLPAPRSEPELVALTGTMTAVAAAARAVVALRHDVLFIAPDSPLQVPDVDSAAGIATAVLAAGDHGAVAEAGRRLDRLADELAGRVAVRAMSPEHVRAVAALRGRDAAGYAAALIGLGAARREVRDENRRRALLRTLAEAAPRLAAAWSASLGDGPGPAGAFGLAAFVSTERLLSALPPPDSADVVVVHRAGGLGMERLLLAAVAPRLVATTVPGGPAEDGATLLGVLHRAAAAVVGPGPDTPTPGGDPQPGPTATPGPAPSSPSTAPPVPPPTPQPPARQAATPSAMPPSMPRPRRAPVGRAG